MSFLLRVALFALAVVSIGIGTASGASAQLELPPVPVDSDGPEISVVGGIPTGWTTQSVYHFECTDSSGVATCPQRFAVPDEGVARVVSVEAVDELGNTSTLTFEVDVDRSAPRVIKTGLFSEGDDPFGPSVFYNADDPEFGCEATDALSGLAVDGCEVSFHQAPIIPGAGFSVGQLAARIRDNAGNEKVVSVLTVYDPTAPTFSGLPSDDDWLTDPRALFWHIQCEDNYRIASCPTFSFSEEGAGQVVDRSVVDYAGNSVAVSVSMNVDFTPPTVEVVGIEAGERLNALPAIEDLSCTASDGVSGLDGDCIVSVVGPNEEGFATVSAEAFDVAGNSGTASVQVIITDDLDDDGVPDVDDNCPGRSNAAQTDTDDDGSGDVCDDDDGDGQIDVDEIACGSDPLDPASLSVDTDGDSSPDCVDTDDDRDGFPDDVEIEAGSDPLNPGSVPPVASSRSAITLLEALIADPASDPEAAADMQGAVDELNNALDELADRDTDKAIDKIGIVLTHLDDAEGVDTTLDLDALKVSLLAAASTAALVDIEEATLYFPSTVEVADAKALVAEGDALRDTDDHAGAAKKYKAAAKKVENLRLTGVVDAATISRIDAANDLIAELQLVVGAGDADVSVTGAIESVEEAIFNLADGDAVAAINRFAEAVGMLSDAEGADPSLDLATAKDEAAEVGRTAAIAKIETARLIAPESKDVADADALVADGDRLRGSDHGRALEKYSDAARNVRNVIRSELARQ
jgi:hypothetical protein